MIIETFYRHPSLPFAECRYSRNSTRHFKPHIHTAFSIGAIAEGEVIFQVGDCEAPLGPGSLALINPEVIHSCNPKGASARSYYMLHLDPHWCLGVQKSMWHVKEFSHVPNILVEDQELYTQFIHFMHFFMEDSGLMEKEELLFDLVKSVFSAIKGPADFQPKPSSKITDLKKLLSSNLEQEITFKDTAVRLDANPYTLLRSFKAVTGISPYAYRLNCRIDLARKLLRQGGDLSEVALDCGFFDQSHFHRHFKAVTTVTPREYQVNFVQ